MPKYIGQPCTSCRSVFRDGDEIVVCPECGSPYHKDCYKREGKCVNTLLHMRGEDWKPMPTAEELISQAGERVCPNCGTHNSGSAYFCTGCGISLSAESAYRRPEAQQGQPNQQYNPYGQYNYPPNAGQNRGYGASPFVNVKTVSAETDVDGNSVGEYTRYVGAKYYYYIPKFLKFANNGGKVSFNIPAFFFPHFWFFYRKMPLYGVITLILSAITSIPSVMEMVFDASPSVQASPSFALFSLMCTIISWAVTILSALFGNYLYYKKAKNDIDNIKRDESNIAKQELLISMRGGASAGLVCLSFVLLVVFSVIISYIVMMM